MSTTTSTVGGGGESSSGSGNKKKRGKAVVHPSLKEPLATRDIEANNSIDADPFYVFREDLYRKLDLVDAGLEELHRTIDQTVSLVALLVR